MKPVWIKYWGVIPMTRRGYVVTLTMAAVLALIVLVACALAGRLPPLSTLWEPDPARANQGIVGLLYNYLYWIILACLVAQAFDTMLVLRRFSQKEAEQRAAEEEGHDRGRQDAGRD